MVVTGGNLEAAPPSLPSACYTAAMNASPSRLLVPPATRRSGWSAYLQAAVAVLAVAAVGAPLLGHLDLANIAMLFPLAVLFAAVRLGRGPAVLAAFLSVALFDFFFVHPHFTLAVSDFQYLLTFAVLLAVALITAHLANHLRSQRDAAERRESHSRVLYQVASELSAALTAGQIEQIADAALRGGYGAHARLWLPDGAPPPADEAKVLRLPLRTPMRERGLLEVRPRGAIPATAEVTQFLETFATLIAISLERVHYIEVAAHTELEMASERLRNSLLGALSHDLRTPLTALVGMAETLTMTQPPLPAAQREVAEAIRDEALRTSTQVDKLLDMARLQSGPITLRREWQPIEEVVGAALRALARTLAGHHLRVELPPDLPLVDIDAALIECVLRNLLENAAKYAPAGSTITVGAAVEGDALAVTVADQGPGLPPGRERQLFDKFSRIGAPAGTPGVGLGLAIVKAIVDAHGGSVGAHNRAEGGAAFVVRLPLGNPPAPPPDYA